MINDVVQRMSAQSWRITCERSVLKHQQNRNHPNPPSEYEASSTGGIVHIILKKARKTGYRLTVYAIQTTGGTPLRNSRRLFRLQTEKFYLFGSFFITLIGALIQDIPRQLIPTTASCTLRPPVQQQ